MLFVLALLQTTLAIRIDKCCPTGYSLDSDSKRCSISRRQHVSNTYNIENVIHDIPENITLSFTRSLCEPNVSVIHPYDRDSKINSSGDLMISDSGPDVAIFPPGTYCMDYSENKALFRLCPCLIMTCVRKCCYDEKMLNIPKNHRGISCIRNDHETWLPNFTIPESPFYTTNGFPHCNSGFYVLNIDTENKPTSFTFQEDGSIQVSDSKSLITKDSYCADISLASGRFVDTLVVCRVTINRRGTFQSTLYSVLLTIGSIFLFFTLLVQYSIPELRRTVHSRNLTSHVSSLFVGYIILSVQSYGYLPSSSVACRAIGYLTQFSFLAAFFWLNVMCIDITWTFSGFRIPEGNSINESEGKKYIYYSIYVWGSSLAIGLITLLADLFGHGSSLTPDFGKPRCWFKGKLATLVYFYLPMSLLLIANVFLFIFTSFKIIKVRRDTGVLLREEGQSSSNFSRINEFKYTLYMKLSLLMGITWIFEVISWAADEEEKYYYIYIFTDGINALRGVFVFFLFCRKRKLMDLAKSKLNSLSGVGIKIRRSRKKTSSSKSLPADSSTLCTSNQTQQTQTD